MYPIQIRRGSAYGEEVTFTEAVQLAMGQGSLIIVTPVYAEDTDRGIKLNSITWWDYIHKAGSPVFDLGVELRARDIMYGEDSDATVAIAGIASHSPEVAMIRIECYTLAAQIAAAANAAAAAVKASA